MKSTRTEGTLVTAEHGGRGNISVNTEPANAQKGTGEDVGELISSPSGTPSAF